MTLFFLWGEAMFTNVGKTVFLNHWSVLPIPHLSREAQYSVVSLLTFTEMEADITLIISISTPFFRKFTSTSYLIFYLFYPIYRECLHSLYICYCWKVRTYNYLHKRNNLSQFEMFPIYDLIQDFYFYEIWLLNLFLRLGNWGTLSKWLIQDYYS